MSSDVFIFDLEKVNAKVKLYFLPNTTEKFVRSALQIIGIFRSLLHKMALNKLSIEKVDLSGKRVLMR